MVADSRLLIVSDGTNLGTRFYIGHSDVTDALRVVSLSFKMDYNHASEVTLTCRGVGLRMIAPFGKFNVVELREDGEAHVNQP